MRVPLTSLHPERQSRLLRAIALRSQQTWAGYAQALRDSQQAMERMIAQAAAEASERREEVRRQRRAHRQRWDEAVEQAIATYERETVQLRSQLNRLAVTHRRQQKAQIKELKKQYQESWTQCLAEHEERAGLPSKQRRHTQQRLAPWLARIDQAHDAIQELTLQWLGQLPAAIAGEDSSDERQETESAAAEGESPVVDPAQLDQVVALLQRDAEALEERLEQLRSLGVPLRRWLLPAAAACLLVSGVVLAGTHRGSWALAAGAVVAVLVGWGAYAFASLPLIQRARRAYPPSQRIAEQAQRVAEQAQKHAARAAAAWTARLVDQQDRAVESLRAEHAARLTELRQQLEEQLATATGELEARLAAVEQHFHQQIVQVEAAFPDEDVALARRLEEWLKESEAQQQQRLQQAEAAGRAEAERWLRRIGVPLRRALQRIERQAERVRGAFPPWSETSLQRSAAAELTLLPLGWIPVGDHLAASLRSSLGADPQTGAASTETPEPSEAALRANRPPPRGHHELPAAMPVVFLRPQQAGVLIDAPSDAMLPAANLLATALWRTITTLSPGRAELTLIDPVAGGQAWQSLSEIGQYEPRLIGHGVRTRAEEIESRCRELVRQMDDVLQHSLRDRYATVEAFNRDPAEAAQPIPYRLVAMVGLPEALTAAAMGHLQRLLADGPRCGIVPLIVRDSSRPWPADLPPISDASLLHLRVDAEGRLWHNTPGLERLPIEPEGLPPAAQLPELARSIGTAAADAAGAAVPSAPILSAWERSRQEESLPSPSGTPAAGTPAAGATEMPLCGLLGTAIDSGTPLTLRLHAETGRNLLLVGAESTTAAVLVPLIATLAADAQRRHGQRLEVIWFDGRRSDRSDTAARRLRQAGLPLRLVPPREAEAEIVRLAKALGKRNQGRLDHPPTLVVLDPLERFRDLRYRSGGEANALEGSNASAASSTSEASSASGGGPALETVLREGPARGVHTLVCCGGAETLARWVPRPAHHDLELRILGRLGVDDSMELIDRTEAAELSGAGMLLCDDAEGQLTRFRHCQLPTAEELKDWIGSAAIE